MGFLSDSFQQADLLQEPPGGIKKILPAVVCSRFYIKTDLGLGSGGSDHQPAIVIKDHLEAVYIDDFRDGFVFVANPDCCAFAVFFKEGQGAEQFFSL